MERTRTKLEAEIKKQAKAGDSPEVLRIKCKSRVQLQKGIERMHTIIANMESVLTQMALQKANIIQALAVDKGVQAMAQINEGMSAKEITALTANYMKEMERFGLSNDLVNEAFSMMDQDLDDAADEETDKVLMEVAGVKLADLKDAGTRQVEARQQQEAQQTMSALPSVPM